jgi:CRP-like cAMP-binding protein
MDAQYIPSISVFEQLAGQPLPAADVIESVRVRRHLQAGEALFHTAQRKPLVYVVNQGVIRLVYETPQGDQWIKGFVQAGICFASLTALQAGGQTSFSAYAEVQSRVEQFDYEVLVQLADQHPAWQRALSQAYKLYGLRKEQREMELLTLSPQERYLSFLRNYPDLACVVKQRDIASYVRVTPVALSRIRARLKALGQL